MSEKFKYDVVIIGAGIVGLATAYMLLEKKRLKIAVIETEKEVAAHQTGNNSGVIHSGLYYKPGSLKALNCTTGREKMYRFCKENDIKHDRCGKIVVATDESEIERLNKLEKTGNQNGLSGIKKLNAEQLREFEPHVNGIQGLYIPQTGIVDYKDVCAVLKKKIEDLGGEIFFEAQFQKLSEKNSKLYPETSQGVFKTENLINCAGLYSDRVAKKCSVSPGVKIVPFRGEYYELTSDKEYLVNNLIYPVPNPEFPFLGVHFTRMIHGGVEAGPNAVLALKRTGYKKSDFSLKDVWETFTYPGFWSLALKYGKTGIAEIYRSISKKAFVEALQKLVPELKEQDVKPAGAGVRAQALDASGKLIDDFKIIEKNHMIHVLNAPSPAATASLSIGETIAEMAIKNFNL